MDEKTTIVTLVTFLLAVLGYLAAHASKLRLDQQTAQLDRVNRQLGELYGPLFAISSAANSAWLRFREKYRPGKAFFSPLDEPSVEELTAWRLWMTEVFMPDNLRMVELVTTKSDLLMDDKMLSCLLKLCAHVAAYKAVLKRWEQNDYSEHTSLVNFPAEIVELARNAFSELQREQTRLLGLVNRRTL